MGKKKKGVSLKVRLILERADGRVLFLKQRFQKGGNFTLAGGNVEEKESAQLALIRETSEEIGISLNHTRLTLVHCLEREKGKDRQMILYFKATYWQGIPYVKEPHKFGEVSWLSLDFLPMNVSPMLRQVLEAYRLGHTYSEYKSIKKTFSPL